MAELTVRARVEADIAACVDALRATHDTDGYPAVWPTDPSRWLTSVSAGIPTRLAAEHAAGFAAGPGAERVAELAAWVATVDDRIVGHVALVAGPNDGATPTAAVVRLFTHPDARTHGVATALLAVALEYLHSNGSRAMLEVADSGAAAIRLYESLGWRRTGERRAEWKDASGRRPMVYDYVLDPA